MPPRNPELPEGTDHVIQGAGRTTAPESGGASSGGNDGGFVASGASGDDTAGLSTGNEGGGGAVGLKDQVRNTAANLQGQATDKVRAYAVQGKDKASGALDEFANVFQDAARSIDGKLGEEYGQYARQAADYVTGVSNSLRDKEIDELFDDARNLVRKSPAVAIGIAAAVGFALVRLAKAGMEPQGNVEFKSDGKDVQFTPAETAASAGGGAA